MWFRFTIVEKNPWLKIIVFGLEQKFDLCVCVCVWWGGEQAAGNEEKQKLKLQIDLKASSPGAERHNTTIPGRLEHRVHVRRGRYLGHESLAGILRHRRRDVWRGCRCSGRLRGCLNPLPLPGWPERRRRCPHHSPNQTVPSPPPHLDHNATWQGKC